MLDQETPTVFPHPLFIEVALIWNEVFEITPVSVDEDLSNLSPLLGEL